MLRGRFGDTTTTPFIEASVHFPRLDLRGYVSFLVDTGASGTVLMPLDSRKLAVNFSLLKNRKTSRTVGGPADGYMEEAVLGFLDRDKSTIFAYEIEIQIFEPTRDNAALPSLLGRDVLNQWRLVVDFPKKNCTCTPQDWSFRISSKH
jgi:predicted aspartyl protease